MNATRLLCFFGLCAVGMWWCAPIYGNAIPVGSSSLISTLDYSDSFTLTANGGIDDRDINAFPMGGVDDPVNGTAGEGLAVENCYGNTPRSWSDAMFSISNDANPINGASVYPGGSGGGSATGMTQTGGGALNWGIEYGLRRQFVIQMDAVQVADRVDVGIGAVGRDDIFDGGDLTVFFRPPGTGFGEITVFSTATGGFDTPFSSGLTAGQWFNYAVKFDLDAKTLEPFVNEVSLGVVDLNTFGGGAFAGMDLSADVVTVGFYNGPDRFWTDNFQVGAPVPEPGILALLLGAVVGLAAWRGRKKR